MKFRSNLPSAAVLLLLALPVAVGLAGTVLPAFGYLPALGGDTLSLTPFRELMAVPAIGRSVLISIATGLAATALSVGAALLLLAALAGTSALDAVRRMLGPMMAVPHAAAAFGLAFLIAPSGLLVRLAAGPLGLAAPPDVLLVNDPFGLAMIAGLVVKEVPFLLLVSLAALPQADGERRLRLARALGYGRLAGFTLAVWPSLYRQIRLPVLAVAAFSSSVADVAIILGPQMPPPLSVRLVEWMSDPDLSRRFLASAGALLQFGLTAAVILVWIGVERVCGALGRRAAATGVRLARDRALRILAPAPAAAAGLALTGGLLALLLWSLAGPWFFPAPLPSAFTARAWENALTSAAAPLRATLVLALASAGIALALSLVLLQSRKAAARRSLGGPAAALLYLPLVVPQIALVFGLQVAQLQVGLAPTLPAVAAAHVVFVLPYLVLSLADPWVALDPRFERIALSLGASRSRTFLRIRLPLMRPAIAAAFAIGVAVSVDQYLPTLLLGQGRVATIATEAVALGAGGNRRVVGVYALLQALLPCIAFALAAGAGRGSRRRAQA